MVANLSSGKLGFGVLVLVTSFWHSPSWGWGKLGHEILAEEGASLSESEFWRSNALQIANLTNVPDWKWKSGKGAALEKPTHWFEIDTFAQSIADQRKFPRSYRVAVQKYGQEAVTTMGQAPWRMKQFYDLAVKAMKDRDFETAVEMAGIMSHYIGDLSQPLHVTENYDGQLTHNSGIHAWFEGQNIKAHLEGLPESTRARASRLLKDKIFVQTFKNGPVEAAFAEVERSLAEKDQVLKNDTKYGREGKGAELQMALAQKRMADGAATLAMILDLAWREAGSPDGVTVHANVPEWIPPEFNETQGKELSQSEAVLDYLEQDDCSRE